MSVKLTAASSQYLSCAAPVAGPPLTMSCVARTSDTISTSTGKVLSLLDGGASNNYYRRGIKAGTQNLRARAGGTTDDLPGMTPVVDTWHAYSARVIGTGDRSLWLDGTGRADSTVTVSPSASTILQIGGNTNSGDYWEGEIADVAIWRGLHSDAEVAMLGRRFCALFVRPWDLLFYATLIGEAWFDCIGGQVLTPNNGPVVGVQPPIIYPAGFEPGTRTVVDPMRFISGAYRRTYFGKSTAAAATRRIMIDDALIVVPA